VKIVSILLFILFIRWAGAKGMIALVLGMAAMAYLILSGNQLMMFFIKAFGNKEYLEEIMGKKEVYHDTEDKNEKE